MDKEAILELIKDSVKIVIEQGERLKTDIAFREVWDKQRKLIDEEVGKADSNTANWLNNEYECWWKSLNRS